MSMNDCRKVTWTVVLSLALAACSGAAPKTSAQCVPSERALSPERIDKLLAPNIVQIKSDASLGSGFLLASPEKEDVLIVTNYHVIAEGETFEVEFVRADQKHVKVGNVEVVKTLPEDDLALLKAPRLRGFGQGLELAKTVHVGESVATLGYPVLKHVSVEPKLSSGLITSTSQTAGDRRFVLTSLALLGGNSGGAAVNSCGRVTGVASAYLNEAHEIGMLVPTDRVVELFTQYTAPRATPKAEIEQRLARFARSLQHEESRAASTYFSRVFYRNVVFPTFRESMDQLSEKRGTLEALFSLLKQKGLDVDELTPEQRDRILTLFDLQYSQEELEMLRVVMESNEKEWDAYKTLQAYFAPFLGSMFGHINDFRIQEVKGTADAPLVYLTVGHADGDARYYQLAMVHEWGDWQIAGVRMPSDAPDPPSAGGSRASTEETSSTFGATDWVPARKSNRP
jgi:hypothetical protein